MMNNEMPDPIAEKMAIKTLKMAIFLSLACMFMGAGMLVLTIDLLFDRLGFATGFTIATIVSFLLLFCIYKAILTHAGYMKRLRHEEE